VEITSNHVHFFISYTVALVAPPDLTVFEDMPL
jgi:hypothetical protein